MTKSWIGHGGNTSWATTTSSLPLCWFFARYHWLYGGPALINPRRNQCPTEDRDLPQRPQCHRCSRGIEKAHRYPEPRIFHRPLSCQANGIIAVGHEEAVPHRHADWVGQINRQGMAPHKLHKRRNRRNMTDEDRPYDASRSFERLFRKAD